MFKSWWRALISPELDLRLSTHRHYETRIVAHPGNVLDDPSLEELVGMLRLVASRTLKGGELTYGIFSGDRERLSRSVVTLITEKATGKPVAFNTLAVMDATFAGEKHQILHLGLVIVDPDSRETGLSSALYGLTVLILFLRGGLRSRWISNVTQVPAIIGMVSETFSDVFPSPRNDTRQHFVHLSLARQIMRLHRHVFGVGDDAGFDEARFVITNAYTGGSDDLKKTFENAPKHRDERYNTFCREMLDYARGDDVLQLGQIDMAAARRYLLREMPKGSLPAIAGAAFFLLLQSMILPVLHWLDTSRPYGLLLPRRHQKQSKQKRRELTSLKQKGRP
uniref:hypothetical protein n=1 Tax=Halomonas sp. TaxID=1486246 RepID=UPI002612F272|nr:hypothetical protein [Halomonas sp.]